MSYTILGTENIEMRKMRFLSLKGFHLILLNGIKAKFRKADQDQMMKTFNWHVRESEFYSLDYVEPRQAF